MSGVYAIAFAVSRSQHVPDEDEQVVEADGERPPQELTVVAHHVPPSEKFVPRMVFVPESKNRLNPAPFR